MVRRLPHAAGVTAGHAGGQPPRRVALIDATMEQDLADLRRQGAAVITFYNHLTPDQQSIFDRQTVPASSVQTLH